jgi:hypothetical protein
MKLFTFVQGFLLVSAGSGTVQNRKDRCNNVVQFFKEDKIINNDSRVMNKMTKVVQNLYENLERAQSKCKKGRDLADDFDFDEDERLLSNNNIEDKIHNCVERFFNYIDAKLPSKHCPKAHTRAKRLLKRMEKQMDRASGLLSERTIESALRSSGSMEERERLSKEQKLAKQSKKFDIRIVREEKESLKQTAQEIKDSKRAEKEAKQAERAAKQERKTSKKERKAVRGKPKRNRGSLDVSFDSDVQE